MVVARPAPEALLARGRSAGQGGGGFSRSVRVAGLCGLRALFALADGFPTHAAWQLGSGRWTSKLGELEDIEHALRDLEGTEYGAVALVMKRPRAVPAQGQSGSSAP
jgi:hypothetical protein